jgi:SET domain-containing protein
MGLFVVNSLANHDCDPNTIILYDGPKAMMRAIRDIEAGTEVGLRT